MDLYEVQKTFHGLSLCSTGYSGESKVQNFLIFMQFFGKFGKIISYLPLPGGLALPPTENPGSAPVMGRNCPSTLSHLH